MKFMNIVEIINHFKYPRGIQLSQEDFNELIYCCQPQSRDFDQEGPFLKVWGCIIRPKPDYKRPNLVDLSEETVEDVIRKFSEKEPF